jgi:3-hydroxy-9,10-secoandrosta-1,3,5(10)-triene-9,17-dione monooxygenase
MSMVKKYEWIPSSVLPTKRVSFADVGYDEMVERAHKLAPTLAKRAEECEKLRRLPDSTERDLHDAGLFRFVQPKRVGGAELDVGIFVDVCAAIARVCPSTAWNVGNLASHHWMLGYFPAETQEELWDVSLDVLIATSLAFAGGRGRKVDGGWEVTGRWPLSSGVDNSDWNMLGFMVRDGENGPVVDQRFALAHRSEYEIIDTWHAVGLCGTGSKDVAVTALFVPERRTLSAWAFNGRPHPGSPVNDTPLFRLPLLALGPYVLSGVMLGCAQGAYELVVGAARKRNATNTGVPVNVNPTVQIKVAEASARIDNAEVIMKRACGHAMTVARSDREPQHDDKVRYRRDAFFATRACLEAVDILMTVAGSGGLYTKGAMQRLFRDAHAANAHVMFSPEIQGAIFGQHALGAPGPAPLL